MDQAAFLFIIKDAIFVRPGLNGETAMLFIAILCDKSCRFDPEEVGNPFYFIFLDKDAPFSEATGSAHLAFKRFHNKIISLRSIIL
jgi:hypothetical protein